MEISINDKAYESYKQKCYELGLEPSALKTLKRDGGVKPNFVDTKLKTEEIVEVNTEPRPKDFDSLEHYFDYYEAIKFLKQIGAAA